MSLLRALRSGAPSRGLRAILSRSGLVLSVLLVLSMLAPPEINAQSKGLVPPGPNVPNKPEDGGKLSMADRPSGPIHVMIELDDEPTVISASRAGGPAALSASASRSQAARIDRAQQTVMSGLQSRGVNARVLYRTHAAYNGIATIVDASQVDRIKAQPGVKDVHEIPLMVPDNAGSIPLINAPFAWTTFGLTGSGRKVGIIDTGIDYVHRNFGGSGNYSGSDRTIINESGFPFPTAVVAGGTDLAGDDYNSGSTDPAKNTPNPDPDPMDCPSSAGGGHGSHVAGTVAGRGVNTDGTTFLGPFTGSVPFNTMKIGPGVAPAASLYAIKVFGCTGSTALVVQALDWALDPNGDQDLSDHLDVVNLSLGSDFTTPDDPGIAAANNSVLAGMIVVGSAGNSGDTTAVNGGVSVATRAIGVAASVDNRAKLDAFNVVSPAGIAGDKQASASSAYNWAGQSIAVSASLAYPPGSTNKNGCSTFAGADQTAISGKIALLDWISAGGTESLCTSATRVNNANAAGAVGVVLANNQGFLETTISGSSAIPAVITTSTVGDSLKTALQSGPVIVKLDKALLGTQTVVDNAQVDRIPAFTSRGPAVRTAALKPDITAPGVTTFSTDSGTGTGGRVLSGTSMAAPHVAGFMALLKQQHPTWTAEELKALAMNTAQHDLFSEESQSGTKFAASRVGAGRIDATIASSATSLAYGTDDPGAVSLSFGLISSLGTTSPTRTLKIVNKSANSIDYTLSYTGLTQVPGTSISFPDGASFTLAAGASTTKRVQLDMTAASMKNPRDPTMTATQLGNVRQYLAEATGLVNVTTSSGQPLRVPLHAAVRPASNMHANAASLVPSSPTQTFSLGLTGQGVNNGGSIPNDITSLVSVFELQATSPAQPGGATADEKAADLRYVGVASDGRAIGTLTGNAAIYFGLALEQPWLLPASEVTFRIRIDNNEDGTDDFEIINTRFVTKADDPTDVFVTGVFNLSNNATSTPFFLNGISPNQPSAIMGNNVLVIAAKAAGLGLTDANSRFNYKVQVQYRGAIRDQTGTLSYDALRPGLDTFTGPNQTPYFFDLPTNSMSVAYNQTNYQANASQGLMLMHHFNQLGQRIDILPVGQTQTVSFAVGTPTSKSLSDPPFAVSATASSGLPVTIASQTTGICTINGSNVVTPVAAGTCTLRASQAGNGSFQAAFTDHNITITGPTINPCSPRPRVVVSASKAGTGKLQVTVTAGNGQVQSIRFGTDTRDLVNGSVQINPGTGLQNITTGATVTINPPVATQAFTVTRTTAGQATTIPMIVRDGCGDWPTFVGMGASF